MVCGCSLTSRRQPRYAAAGRREEALKVLDRELRTKPDHPRLLCCLGDLRDDPALYEKAWAASGRRDWRAARSLGRRHLAKGEWALAAPWLDETVRARPQATASWRDARVRFHAASARAEAAAMAGAPSTPRTATRGPAPI